MSGESYHLVIEWDLREDQDFSIHKVLTAGIYAAHDPLTGFLGKVFKSIKKGVSKVFSKATEFVSKITSSPIGKALLGVVGTIASGGALGPALLAGGLTAVGLPGEMIIAEAGGISAMVSKYLKPLGGLMPQGVWDTMSKVAGTITSVVGAPLKGLYERFKPLVKGWVDHFSPVVERLRGILGPWMEILPADQTVPGLGSAWADKRITGEIMSDILMTLRSSAL